MTQDNPGAIPLHPYVGEIIILRTGQTIAERTTPTVRQLRVAFAPANDLGFCPLSAA